MKTTGLVVLKFGGSSMGTPERIGLVARRVASFLEANKQVVVVVSAMQGETDRLLSLLGEVVSHGSKTHSRPNKTDVVLDVQVARERDQVLATGEQVSAALLALALASMGIAAKSFGGAQMRLFTDGNFSRARLKKFDKTQVCAALSEGHVVVATGFQGVDERGNLTTLGRGGSDTSAVALAAVLKAESCEIFTDVDGVYTADPRICPEARKLDQISGDEMLEMASLGSRVLQIRSVELAMNHDVPVRVRSTFSDDPGTLVTQEPAIERINVIGVSHALQEAKVSVRNLPEQTGAIAKIFGLLSQNGINVDVIVQNLPHEGHVNLSFTIGSADTDKTKTLLLSEKKALGFKELQIADDVGKVSIVGVGMMSHPGVAADMFRALDAQKIVPQLISTSEIKITCIVERKSVTQAVVALHRAFHLERPRLIQSRLDG